ncbi:ATP-grasp domain-containing protein [Actinokineospora alba]|uniref:ATP-grasp domain-containing protein n=1 Tax=Actinokineospora alba TaxID=504798 RepID=A0A1H0FZW1_9PSEU|nr:ATP-grasp domain-containing protein [Actinokineospora alba]TDP69699.1 ATP-grasp domain-containing protein [Actinokineospora alba]SDI10762.1 ATP-grasp domain-containing protein [Actinokineospora alba]SDO00173.1 ATP-grasp domain-containing protein [Actinokineospora alba]
MTGVSHQPTAVIVDGYSTGNFLPAAFARIGVRVVHVRSSAELMASMVAPEMADYDAEFVCPDAEAFDRTCAQLAELNPVAVLTGQEPGVPLADALSERLGLATNGSALSRARRDKYTMIETLRTAGIHCADQILARSAAEAVAWAEERGEYPVVVKPLSSASSDCVSVCRDAGEVAAGAAAVLAAVDIFDRPNTEVLVQSFLSGTEYIVDTVAVAGRRYVCGVWAYDKTTTAAGKRTYDRDILLDSAESPVPELVAYLDTVLAALGIVHGPAHAEVIITPDGPALVEIGARLNGNMNPGFHDACLGANQADLIALAYARPDEFLERYADRVYTRRQPAIVHSTTTDLDGIVSEVDQAAVAAISELPSVHLVGVKLAPGNRIRPTEDLLTSPLRIFMTAPDPVELDLDYKTIQTLKDQVYRIG